MVKRSYKSVRRAIRRAANAAYWRGVRMGRKKGWRTVGGRR